MENKKNKKNKPPLKKDDRVTLDIDMLAFGGDGVAKYKDYTVFVGSAAPGDQCEVRVTQAKKNYGRAAILDIKKPGPDRIKPPCGVAKFCGGCSWQHLDYSAQLAAKAGFIRESLRRIGNLDDVELEPIQAARNPLAYRNKAIIPVRGGHDDTLRLGYFKEGSHDVIALPGDGCLLQSKAMNEVICFVRERLNENNWQPYKEPPGEGLLRHLVMRDNYSGQVMLALVTTKELTGSLAEEAAGWVKKCPALLCVLNHVQPDKGNVVLDGETITLSGPALIEEKLGDFHFQLSLESFFQVNREQTLKIWNCLEKMRSWCGEEIVLELYSGAGTLSLFVSGLCGKLWGFESNRKAVDNAKKAAERNRISNTRFICEPAERAFEKMWEESIEPDVVVLDPPRKGLSETVMASLLTNIPGEILYVSCDPASLARDLGLLAQGGYNVEKVIPVDLFPQTWHVENVAFLRKNTDK